MTTFDEFLFLDNDNGVVRDPSYLFDYMEEQKVTALFWPDLWEFRNKEIWKYFNGGPINEY